MKRILAMLLTVCLLMSFFPANVSAATSYRESEPNNYQSSANRIYHDYTVSGTLDDMFGSDYIDYYTFTLKSATTVTILSMSATSNLGFRLDSSTGYICGSTANGTYQGKYVDIIERYLSAGTYYISVVGTSTSDILYVLNLDAPTATAGHSHSYSETVTAPTCTTDGYTTYVCSCGDSYIGDKVSATGHVYGEWVLEKEPTVAEDGLARRTCLYCDAEETEVVPAGTHYHVYRHWVTVVKPTTTTEGLKERTCACGDKQQATLPIATGANMESAIPMEFGQVFTKTWGTYTEYSVYLQYDVPQDGYITIHNDVQKSAYHNYDAEILNANGETCWEHDMTFDKSGNNLDSQVLKVGLSAGTYYLRLKCYGYGQTLPLTHSVDFTPASNYGKEFDGDKEHANPMEVGVTYSGFCGQEEGEFDSYWVLESDVPVVCKIYFTNLDYILAEDDSNFQMVMGNLDKTYYFGSSKGSVKEDEQGKYVRGHLLPGKNYIRIEGVGPQVEYTLRAETAEVHVPGEPTLTTKPTCDKDGVYAFECQECGLEWNDIAPATGHSWDDGVVTTEPTEEAEGVRTYTCSGCKSTRTESIDKLEHTHKYTETVTAPTCTEDGYTTHSCTCGDSYVDTHIEATGHEAGTWYIDEEPVNGVGKMSSDCVTCGEVLTDTFDMPLTDIPNGKYYSKPVFWAYVNGITKGKTATEFQRDASCTRKQIVMFLWRAAGEPEPTNMSNPFVDVKADQFEKAILWAAEKGITAGTGDGSTFSPENPCTRDQIVMFLWRYFGKPDPASMINPFSDVKPGTTFEKPILWAYYQGITTGKTNTTFDPKGTCTRGQIVTFLYRAMVPGSTTPPEIPTPPETPEIPSEPQQPAEDPIVAEYNGYGDDVITGINLPVGEYYVECFHNASGGNFISKLYYGDKEYSYVTLTNKIGTCAIRSYLDETRGSEIKNAYITVKANGSWTFRIRQLTTTSTTNIAGNGNAITGTFIPTTTNVTIKLNHTGTSNFIVKLYEYGGKSYDYETLVNKIGNYTGTTIEQVEPGKKYFFYVRADGDWTIDMGNGDTVTTYQPPVLNGDTGDTSDSNKWSFDEAQDLNQNASYIMSNLTNALNAMTSCMKTSNTSMKVTYARQSLSYVSTALAYAENAMTLLEENADLELTGSEYATMREMMEDLISKLEAMDSTNVTTSNVSGLQISLTSDIQTAGNLALRFQKLTVSLLEQFV